MKVKLHELAILELNEAVEWYEAQSKGLGQRFKLDLLDQIKKIQLHPSWFLPEEEPVFKAYIPKFPYKLLYSLSGQ